MKKRKKRSIIIISTIVVSLLILGGAFVFKKYHDKKTLASNQAVDHPKDDPNLPRQSSTTPPATGAGSGSSNQATALAKPTLNKSSGNSPTHTVPVGILMNFICNTDMGNNCTIILTDKTNSAHKIDLGAKAMQSSYGQPPFASWDWTSVRGSWSIVAHATSNSGASRDSDPQDLQVQ